VQIGRSGKIFSPQCSQYKCSQYTATSLCSGRKRQARKA
jgi:hypothetical protein